MDDGSRVTIFNSANPGGLVVPGSYVFLGGSGTTNLAPHVVVGETNRVVITQVDDCPVGNTLAVASVVLNGQVVPPAPLNQPPTCQGPVLITTPEDTPVTRNLASQCSDPDAGDTIQIEIVSLSLTSVSPVPLIGPLPHTLPAGAITLNPSPNYSGPGGSFQFRARDSKNALSNVATANVAVNPVNDPPVVTAPPAMTMTEGTSSSVALNSQATDVETPQPNIIWSATSSDPAVTVSIDPGRNLVINAGEGPASATVTITGTDRGDPNGCLGGPPGCSGPLSASASFTVNVSVPPVPAFSGNVQPPPNSCICTPLIMNSVNTGIEHWWVKSDGSGTLTLTATAHSVNALDPETLVARIYPASGVGPALATLTASYPAGTPAGSEVSASGSISTTANTVYLIRITTPTPTPPTQPHYSLKIHGATQAAVKSPTFRSFEPHANVR